MTFKYVFSETRNGLRRNMNMLVALIVTIFISLTLVGIGLLLRSQSQLTQQSWGSAMQIQVNLCNKISASPNCAKQEVTPSQQAQVLQTLHKSPWVAKSQLRSKQYAFDHLKKLFAVNGESSKQVYGTVTVNDMEKTVVVTLNNPKRFGVVEQSVAGLPGVDNIRDAHKILQPVYFWINFLKWAAIAGAAFLLAAAILQVATTIRLATYARRKEIGIMRLVGASSLYISLPFLAETLVAAIVGIGLAGLAIAAFTWFVVYDRLRGHSHLSEWISWQDSLAAFIAIAILGVLLTVVPTLLMTRRYLKV